MLFQELGKLKRSSIMTSIIMMAVGILMIMCPAQYVGALVSALLILLHRMMVPTPIREAGWLKRLDDLLTNGRAPLYLQLPMICAWYAGLLHLLACECFAGATLLQRLLPRLGGRQCALLFVATIALAAAFLPVIDIAEMLSPWQYIAVAPLTALITFVAAGRKGGAASCA